MIRERSFAARLSLKTATHALRASPENCQVFVDKLGLKPLFALFMGARLSTKSGEIAEDEERICTIVHSLCRYCTGTPAARVLNKFTENSFQKLERLIELHEQYWAKLEVHKQNASTSEVYDEVGLKDELRKEQEFLDRCNMGLFTLQQVDFTVIRLANMGNKQMSTAIASTLQTKGVPSWQISEVVTEYCEYLGKDAEEERKELTGFLKAFK